MNAFAMKDFGVMESGVHLSAIALLVCRLRQPHPLKFPIGSVLLQQSALLTNTSFLQRLYSKTGVARCVQLEITFTALTASHVRATLTIMTCFPTRRASNVGMELHQMIARAVNTLHATWRLMIVLHKPFASTCVATAVGTCVNVPWGSGATANGALHGRSASLVCRMKLRRPLGSEIAYAAQ
jgi:hypothetical protein